MVKTIGTSDVRQSLGDLLNRIDLRHDEYIIERKGKALAAMVPVARLRQMQRAAELHLEQVLNQRPRDITQKGADKLADEAKHASRPAKD